MIASSKSTPPKILTHGYALAASGAFYAGFLPHFLVASAVIVVMIVATCLVINWCDDRAAAKRMAPDLVIPPSVTDRDLEEVKKYLKKRKAMTNGEVAELLGVSPGEASKRITTAVKAGLVSRVRVGKEVAITLH